MLAVPAQSPGAELTQPEAAAQTLRARVLLLEAVEARDSGFQVLGLEAHCLGTKPHSPALGNCGTLSS